MENSEFVLKEVIKSSLDNPLVDGKIEEVNHWTDDWT